MICQTPRLTLREFHHDDAPFIVTLLNDKSFIENIVDKNVRTNDDAIKYLNDGPMASYDKHGYGLYMVTLKDCDTPIGMCGLVKRDDFDYADIGYSLLPQYYGQGYAIEAAKAIVDFCQNTLGFDTLAAITKPANSRSNSLLDKLGFEFQEVIEYYDQPTNFYLLALN